MPREFSENSKRLLKDSLTLEIPSFPGRFAVPEWGERAEAAELNPAFTMTARRGEAMPHSVPSP
jgi:hypothetical protein